MSKLCKKCLIEKDITDFYKQKNAKDGYKNECKKCFYEKNKDKINEYNKNNKEQRKNINKKYRDGNKDKINEYNKKYYKEYMKIYMKEYNITNKDKLTEYNRNYHINRKYIDPEYRIMCNIRCMIYKAFKNQGYKKNSKTFNILGCTYEFFLEYIINQFEPWMTLENHGIYTGNYNETWQLDHIQPISNAKNEDEIIKLNHYTNFRPLCSKLNSEKSNK